MIEWLGCYKNKFIHPSVLLPTWLSDWGVIEVEQTGGWLCFLTLQSLNHVGSKTDGWMTLFFNTSITQSRWKQNRRVDDFVFITPQSPNHVGRRTDGGWICLKTNSPTICSTSNMIEWLRCYKNKFIHPSVLLPTWLSDWGVIKTNSPTVCSTSSLNHVESRTDGWMTLFFNTSITQSRWKQNRRVDDFVVCSTSNMIEWLGC
jgi:ribosomal protein L39E